MSAPPRARTPADTEPQYVRRSGGSDAFTHQLQALEIERDEERRTKTFERGRAETAPAATECRLRNSEQVVAVHDGLACNPLALADGHLGRETTYCRGHRSNRDIGEQRDRPVSCDDDDGATPALQLNVVNVAAIQSRLPPSAA